MAMSTTLTIATALSGLSILLLFVLTGVWVRNYRTFESTLTLGLIAFGAAMLLENALAIYFFFSTTMLYSGDPVVQTAILALRSLQLLAIAFLTYVTVK
ncbi:hypothetical protein SAMN04487950_0055 [Halogranum rubrum]|uniref:Uncharacterized protein n=2 Tax=Halogranum rubrum TaxID=553466 RepID=A0A1I4AQY1_9EURY|nr:MULTISPECIES: hypothetical protein [Halogranum]EJN58370.1 hypothetical protein HSB1_37870 [Halogranum salarium B-1]SFK58942.1 hypothetical protein SAMN04487950_0055 [Halogranum rubrum]